jgi:hypothetical protein
LLKVEISFGNWSRFFFHSSIVRWTIACAAGSSASVFSCACGSRGAFTPPGVRVGVSRGSRRRNVGLHGEVLAAVLLLQLLEDAQERAGAAALLRDDAVEEILVLYPRQRRRQAGGHRRPPNAPVSAGREWGRMARMTSGDRAPS